jgi:hypothetical protein
VRKIDRLLGVQAVRAHNCFAAPFCPQPGEQFERATAIRSLSAILSVQP